ncbi:ATP-binding protein [Pseudobutyrivibrio sp.]
MSYLVYSLFSSHFTLTIILASIFTSYSLEKKSFWVAKSAIAIVFAIIVGGTLEYYGLFSQSQNLLLVVLVYALPLIISYLYLSIAVVGKPEERLYALSLSYLTQHMGNGIEMMIRGYEEGTMIHTIIDFALRWIIVMVVFVCVYLFITSKLPMDGHYRVTIRNAILTFLLVMILAMGLNIIYKFSAHISTFSYNIGIAYDIFSCLFLLMIQLEQRKEIMLWAQVEIEENLRLKNFEQYEKAKANVEIINQKCHDIKHNIAALRMEKDPKILEEGLKEMETAVLNYDALAETGNEVLDVLLSEKGLICEQKDIQWTCMANGKLIDFMATVDIYTMLGNALDNAIESAIQVEDKNKRIVSITLTESMGMALIQIENYYANPIKIEDGKILTTKEDKNFHGYGLKSIKTIVGRYNGVMDISADDGLFILSIMIPLQSTKYEV